MADLVGFYIECPQFVFRDHRHRNADDVAIGLGDEGAIVRIGNSLRHAPGIRSICPIVHDNGVVMACRLRQNGFAPHPHDVSYIGAVRGADCQCIMAGIHAGKVTKYHGAGKGFDREARNPLALIRHA